MKKRVQSINTYNFLIIKVITLQNDYSMLLEQKNNTVFSYFIQYFGTKVENYFKLKIYYYVRQSHDGNVIFIQQQNNSFYTRVEQFFSGFSV